MGQHLEKQNDRPKRNTPAGEAPQGAGLLDTLSRGHFGDKLSRSYGERANAGTRRRNGVGKPFREERQRKARWRERMRDNPYKDLPPLETQAGRFPLPHDTGAKETGGPA